MMLLLALLLAQSPSPATITKPGTSAKNAQAVQGVTGGVPIPVQGVAGATSDVELHDHTTPANHLAIDGSGLIGLNNFPVSFDVTDRIARLVGHVICDSGCSGGANDLALTSAADETLATRAAVTAALRLRDTGLGSGAQLIGWKGDATSGAWVNIKNASIAVTGSFWQVTQPVSGTFWPTTAGSPLSARLSDGSAFYDGAKTGQLPTALDGSGFLKTHEQGTATTDPSDRAARLLGVVYGSQSQQLKQTATNFNLQAELAVGGTLVDPRSIRALTSGDTVTTAPPSNASTNVTQWNGTTVDTNSGTKSAGTVRVVLATDQPQLTNKLLVTPDSVALPANQSVNVAQLAGTTTDTNSGTKSAGTLRVVLATDQPALTNKLLVTPDSVALPANQSVNVAQVGGTNTVSGGAAGTLAVGGTQANNAAITANPILDGVEAISTQPTAATTGNARRIIGSLDGAMYVRPNGPIIWTCIVSAQTVKKTCQAAPGANLKLYVTDVYWTNNSATATSALLASGTGADCVTTTNNKTAAHTIPVSGAGSNVWLGGMTTPVAMNANEALCTVPGGANSYSATISGFTAP